MDIANFKEFDCSICNKIFNSEDRLPKILSCGHSFCLTCMKKLINDSLPCPNCKMTIQFSSVDLVPVNILIESCVSKFNVKSGVKRKVDSDHQATENLESGECSSAQINPKRKKLLFEGHCDDHEYLNELRCMDCETWICPMCATLRHKQCFTLLVEDAYKDIRKKNCELILNELNVRKLRFTRTSESLKIIEEKKMSLKQEIQDLQLKLEAKLKEHEEEELHCKELQAVKLNETRIQNRLNEIQILNNISMFGQEILEAKNQLDALIHESNNDMQPLCSTALEVIFDEVEQVKEESSESFVEKDGPIEFQRCGDVNFNELEENIEKYSESSFEKEGCLEFQPNRVEFVQKSRGRCFHEDCRSSENGCLEFTPEENKKYSCGYCGHIARSHASSSEDSIRGLFQRIDELENTVLYAIKNVEVVSKKSPSTSTMSDILENLKFPINTMDELVTLENNMKIKSYKDQLISFLSRKGGRNFKDITRNVMAFIFTRHLASQLSMTGRKGSKVKMCDKLIMEVILSSVLQHEECKQKNEHQIKQEISNFFRCSPHQPGGPKYEEKRNRSILNTMEEDWLANQF